MIGDVSDLLEIGDFHAMGAWAYYELGDFPRSLEAVDAGIALVVGRAPNVESHLRSWRCVSLFRIGRWDEAVREFELVRALLDDRRDEPPYFAAHSYATAAICFHARGEQVEADRLTDLLLGLPNMGARLYPGLLRLLVRRGDLEAASARPQAGRRGRSTVATRWKSESEWLAARAAWPEAAAFAAEMRAQAEENGTVIVSAFADRLEGRAAIAGGDAAPRRRAPHAGRRPVRRARRGLGTRVDRGRPGRGALVAGPTRRRASGPGSRARNVRAARRR